MSRKFGKIAQIGYVVRDIDAAMELSVALANSGDIQIELIQPRNDAPSM
jgi:hypothetical protein